jgi:hypothetical protein
MATATKSKRAEAATDAAPAVPVTFAEINARKVRERIESYREIVTRYAAGNTMTVEDMERAAELLEHLGLPQYAFTRDAEALQRAKVTGDKLQAALDGQPANAQRAADLAVEIEALRKKLETLREEHRRASAGASKGGAYDHTLRQLAHEHPHVLADLDTAVQHRIEELDRRKQIGGAA